MSGAQIHKFWIILRSNNLEKGILWCMNVPAWLSPESKTISNGQISNLT